MSINFKFSAMVYEARVAHGLTQEEAAEAISITLRWYQRIESGERLPSTKVFLKIIFLFDLDISELKYEINLPALKM